MCFFKKWRKRRKEKKAEKAISNDKVEVNNIETNEEKHKNTTPAKYHISQNKDEKSEFFKHWRVRKEGSDKTIKYFKTQLEAIDYATHLAKQANSSIVIHKVDGTIRRQDYSK